MLGFDDSAMLAIDSCSQGDDDATDTSIDCTEGILYLGQHATTDGAVSLVAFEVGMGDGGNHAVVVIGIAEHTFLFKREDEGDVIAGSQRLGGL